MRCSRHQASRESGDALCSRRRSALLVGEATAWYASTGDHEGEVVRTRVEALVARLPDGRILLAGGLDSAAVASAEADLYDPATDMWTALEPMPESRARGTAVFLADGSVLLVGGRYPREGARECGNTTTGLASAIRFVPSP